MPNTSTPRPTGGLRYSGVFKDMVNGQTELYDDGVLNQTLAGSAQTVAGAQTVTGAQTFTGIATHSAELRVAEGFNLRIGTISTFGTTEPTNAVVMKVGTNPVGAITTSGGIFVTTGGATISKIIAAGTVSQIEA